MPRSSSGGARGSPGTRTATSTSTATGSARWARRRPAERRPAQGRPAAVRIGGRQLTRSGFDPPDLRIPPELRVEPIETQHPVDAGVFPHRYEVGVGEVEAGGVEVEGPPDHRLVFEADGGNAQHRAQQFAHLRPRLTIGTL